MEKLSNESALGFIGMFAWCIISAVAYVFTTLLEMKIDATLLCFGIFLIAAIFFFLSRLNSLKSLKTKCQSQLLNLLIINVTTFGCWFLSIFPLQYMEPSVAQSILAAAVPIATLIIGIILYKGQNVGYLDYIISILLFLGIFFMVLTCLEQKISIQTYSLRNLIIAILCCIAAGVSLAANNIYAKKLSKGGFSPFDILAIRFFLLIVVTGAISYPRIHEIYKIEIFENILISAFSLVIIPQIIFQYSLKELEPITISIISPLMPIMIFITEIFTNKLNPNFITVVGIIFICLVSIVGAKVRYSLQRVNYQNTSNLPQRLKQETS